MEYLEELTRNLCIGGPIEEELRRTKKELEEFKRRSRETKKENILILNDDSLNMSIIRKLFKHTHYNLIITKTDEETLEVYKSTKDISIVLLPITSNLDTIRYIRDYENTHDTHCKSHIIAVTHNSFIEEDNLKMVDEVVYS